MKKILAVILSVLLVFVVTACDKETANNKSNISDISQDTNTSSVVSKKNKSNTVSKKVTVDSNSSNSTSTDDNTNQLSQISSSLSSVETSSEETLTSSNINESAQSSSSKISVSTSSKGTVTNNNTSSKKVDNDDLENENSKSMNVPENMKLLSTNQAKEENSSTTIKANVSLYELDGDVVNWTTENDLLYVITKGNNRLVVINSKTMEVVSNVPLAGVPAELNFVDDKIYISLPDLCRIDIFSKSNPAKLSSLYFDHEVSSFCVDGDYIYYSEYDQHCDVYRKNIVTDELTEILPDRGWSFYQPKLYLNKEDNILYIGETSCSGCAIFYYDATTLQLKSLFRKNDYGIWNHTRDIFHIGDEIFWGNYRISDTNAKQIVGRYGAADYGSVNFVSESVVSTYEGLFLTDTYECIVEYSGSGFNYDYTLVTDSYNIFFRARGSDANIIIGVNFSMQ